MMNEMKPGTEIDGFTLGDRVHGGAMSTLFRVSKPGIDQPLVMKVPRVGPKEPRESIISFETEALIFPSLKGPHVPSFVAVGDLAQTPYLVTEYGIANLIGRSTWERAERIINIAHPRFREGLIREAEKMKIWRRSCKK